MILFTQSDVLPAFVRRVQRKDDLYKALTDLADLMRSAQGGQYEPGSAYHLLIDMRPDLIVPLNHLLSGMGQGVISALEIVQSEQGQRKIQHDEAQDALRAFTIYQSMNPDKEI